jgi:protein TonB
MENEIKRIPGFDDIVFEIRNKEYGAYMLRKNYNRNVIISLLTALFIMSAGVIAPFLNAKATDNGNNSKGTEVQLVMQQLDQPDASVTPPPPPPPPVQEVTQQVKYIPPVVVDSVKPEDQTKLITAVEAQDIILDDQVTDLTPKTIPESDVTDIPPEPFIFVEEMPVPLGGDEGLLRYIAENIIYPDVARENNIQGRVIVKFCVTSKGGIDMVTVMKGVDPALDEEAIRVVKTLPAFKPGKQGGKAVPVWYTVPIVFKLNN